MFVYRLHSAAVLAGALCNFFAPATAQNASSTDMCPRNIGEFDQDASVNSTGKVKFQLGDDVNYILSVTYNDTRRESTENVRIDPEVLHDVQGWISAPNDSTGYVCVYKFKGLNASSPEGDLNGCGGVLSKACMDKIEKMDMAATSDANEHCTSMNARIDSLREACGDHFRPEVSTDFPIDLSNTTCAVSSPQGVSVPDDYRTLAAIGIGAPPRGSDSYSTFDNYDLFVRQTIPWIVSSTSGSTSDGGSGRVNTRVVCVAPDTVLPGSRIPEKKFGTWEEENSAVGSADLHFSQKLAVAVAATVSLGLVLY